MKQLSQVEIAKMRKLADFLDTVPEEDFDLGYWIKQEPEAPVTRLFGLITTSPGCGFAGCAMGWAAHAKLFPGFRIVRDDEGEVPVYGGKKHWAAIARLFGVNEGTAQFFFAPDLYAYEAAPFDVSQRVRRFAEIVERRLARRERPPLRVVA